MTLMETKEKEVKAKKESFDTFMENPIVRHMISTIPSGQQKDGLRTLLQAAFEAGFNSGAGAMVGDLITSVLRERTEKKPY